MIVSLVLAISGIRICRVLVATNQKLTRACQNLVLLDLHIFLILDRLSLPHFSRERRGQGPVLFLETMFFNFILCSAFRPTSDIHVSDLRVKPSAFVKIVAQAGSCAV